MERFSHMVRAILALPATDSVPRDHFNEVIRQLDEAKDTNKSVEALLARARTELTESKATVAALAASASALSATRPVVPVTPKLPKPEPFSGDREKLRTFLGQLRIQCATITDPQASLRYAFSLLRGVAAAQILPYVKNDRIELTDLAALVTILENAFGNPNRQREAERKLITLRMGTRDFSAYFAKFQRYA